MDESYSRSIIEIENARQYGMQQYLKDNLKTYFDEQ